MTDAGLPDGVGHFITRHIDSVELLETLLLLARAPEAEWGAGAVAAALYTRPASPQRRLASLGDQALIELVGDKRYRFGRDPRIAVEVGNLAAAFTERRAAVITLIASRPMDNVRAFSDAFKLRRKDPLMAAVVYYLCALRASPAPSSCFAPGPGDACACFCGAASASSGLALNNALLVLDRIIRPDRDLGVVRSVPALIGIMVLVYGLIRDTP